MRQKNRAAIVLAAGEGKRMESDRAKVLHEVAGVAMIDHVQQSIRDAGIDEIVIITGHREDQVRGHLGASARCVTQPEPRGTGHAVMFAEPAFESFDGAILVACGDVPLLRSETIRAALDEFDRLEAGAVVLTTEIEDPTGYGRVLRDEKGDVVRIVEHKDATEEERRVREINSGTYVFDARGLFAALKRVTNDNAQGEYYLPDVIEILLGDGLRVGAFRMKDPSEAMGVNSRQELEKAEGVLAARGG